MSSPHDGCRRAADAVRADLRAACESLRAESRRDATGWPEDARATWERERDRIDESVGEITVLLEILDEALSPPAARRGELRP